MKRIVYLFILYIFICFTISCSIDTSSGHNTSTSYCENHQFDSGIVTKEPKNKTDGEILYTCSICNYEKKESIHPFETTWTSNSRYHWHKAACTHKTQISSKELHNWYINTENQNVCSVCGFVLDVTTNDLVTLSPSLEIPKCDGNLVAEPEDHQIREFTYYTVCYRESYEEPEWSAYRLTSDQLVKNTDRNSGFRQDKSIKTGTAVSTDYSNSGYDKGHLTPAGDMLFDEAAEYDTFYLSNICPQTSGLNRGLWSTLEDTVRKWCSDYQRVYVVSGPVLNKSAEEFNQIGEKNKISVPEYFYKVILVPIYKDEEDLSTPEDAISVMAVGFVMPNEKCTKNIWDYAKTIDEIETLTGLDFFSALDDSIENKIETEFNQSLWQ